MEVVMPHEYNALYVQMYNITYTYLLPKKPKNRENNGNKVFTFIIKPTHNN